MAEAVNPFAKAGNPVATISPVPSTPAPIKTDAAKVEQTDVETERAKVTKALADANVKAQQKQVDAMARSIMKDEKRLARPLKTVVVEGSVYSAKLKRIESILRRDNQSIAMKLQDIDTVIKE